MTSATTEPLFLPKLASALKGYTRKDFAADAVAGLIVGIVALPLAIAFGVASGVTPDRSLATAIVAGFLVSALGGSRVQIGGPTGAFVVIVYGIVQRFGLDGLMVCTLMAGLILIVMGVTRLGSVIKFIPYPVTVGFTSGIAVVIFTQQIADLLGLRAGALPADFLARWKLYFQALPTANPWAIALSAGSLVVLALWPRVSRRVPGSLIVLVGVTALAVLFKLPVETIGSRFPNMPAGLPLPHAPHIDWSVAKRLVGPAFTVALLGAIESLLSATVADGMTGGRHRANTELIAQGLANIAAPLFGGIPATGAIARTATNVKNGARTPVAGIVHALTLFLIVLFFGRWAALIPMAALAAILVLVCWHMSEWHAVKALMKAPRTDVLVLATTFLLTVLVDLVVAVQVGLLLSLVLFTKQMSEATHAEKLRDTPPGVVVYELEGALFFGVAAQLRETLFLGAAAPKLMILDLHKVLHLDASGIKVLQELERGCKAQGTRMVLAGLREKPAGLGIETAASVEAALKA